MLPRIVPMIHVPDVLATADWYGSIGFTIVNKHRECDEGEVVFTLLRLGESEVMLSAGGKPSDAHRREFDLYIHTSGVDQLYEQLKSRVDVFEEPHDTAYGAREFIIRDYNRFWITFAEPKVNG